MLESKSFTAAKGPPTTTPLRSKEQRERLFRLWWVVSDPTDSCWDCCCVEPWAPCGLSCIVVRSQPRSQGLATRLTFSWGMRFVPCISPPWLQPVQLTVYLFVVPSVMLDKSGVLSSPTSTARREGSAITFWGHVTPASQFRRLHLNGKRETGNHARSRALQVSVVAVSFGLKVISQSQDIYNLSLLYWAVFLALKKSPEIRIPFLR